MTPEDFLARGYQKWKCDAYRQYADSLLQKRVRDSIGQTKYFIDVYAYDWRKHKANNPSANFPYDWSFEAEITYYRKLKQNEHSSDHMTFTVQFLVEDIDVLEQVAEEHFVYYGSVPNIWNNDKR